MIAARRAIKMTLMERCQKNELEHVETLEWIAKFSKNDNARINAINTLFDRGRGRAVQPEQHSGSVTLQVITGVPGPDDDDEPAEPRVPYSPPVTIEHRCGRRPSCCDVERILRPAIARALWTSVQVHRGDFLVGRLPGSGRGRSFVGKAR